MDRRPDDGKDARNILLSRVKKTGWANKKRATLLLFISLLIIDQFSKFFHWHTLWRIWKNVIIMYPTTP